MRFRPNTAGTVRKESITNIEAAEDIYYGQTICVWARWFVAAVTALLVLWVSDSSGELARRIFLVLGLVAVNFYLQGRQMMSRPANAHLLTLVSLIDLGVIAAIIGFFGEGSGLNSPHSILFYPVVFAYSLVFPPRWAASFTGIATMLYAVICLIGTPSLIGDTEAAKLLAMRLITIAAMGGLGAFFWRVQRQKRRNSRDGEPGALEELGVVKAS